MLTGYWPVLGNAWAVVTREGRVVVVAPEDEVDLAREGFADEVIGFQAASLDRRESVIVAVREPLRRALGGAKIVGYEHGASLEPASYVSTYRYGPAARDLLTTLDVEPRRADALMEELRLRKTPREIAYIRTSCEHVGRAFAEGARSIEAGATERHVVAAFSAAFERTVPKGARAQSFFFCMSGPNGFEAFRAYQRTRARKLERSDSVLVHCNATLDGYWTDVTRSYVVGDPGELAPRLEAIDAARAKAFERIRPGARAKDVDAASLDELRARGFGDEIRHSTGHGVGFAAIDHDERPRLHPCGTDVLEPGMTFNVEPGLYRERCFGLRRCDVVAVTRDGYELLTRFD